MLLIRDARPPMRPPARSRLLTMAAARAGRALCAEPTPYRRNGVHSQRHRRGAGGGVPATAAVVAPRRGVDDDGVPGARCIVAQRTRQRDDPADKHPPDEEAQSQDAALAGVLPDKGDDGRRPVPDSWHHMVSSRKLLLDGDSARLLFRSAALG